VSRFLFPVSATDTITLPPSPPSDLTTDPILPGTIESIALVINSEALLQLDSISSYMRQLFFRLGPYQYPSFRRPRVKARASP